MTPPPLPTPPALPEAPAPATLPALPARVGMAMLTTGGGSSTLAIALGRELAARGLGVRYCHCDPDAPRQLPGAAVLTAAAGAHTARLLDIDRALVGGIDAASQLLAWYDAAPFDLLHLHSLQAFGLPAAMLARLRGVPYVVTLHGSDVLSPHLMDANRAVVGDLLAGAAAMTCVSAFLARQLERQLPGLGAVVVHNFLAHDFRPADLATTAETGAATAGTATAATAGTADAVAAGPPFPAGPRRRAHFVHISSLREVKRPQLLFAAFQQLRARHPAAHLAVVSTRRGLARAAELLPAYNLQGAVTLADGDDGPQALLRHYREATALVLTSRFESFGLVILEALAHGLPVVAPAVGGIPEVLGDDWPLLVHDVDAAPAYAAAMIAADGGGGGAVAGAMRTLAPRILQRFAPTRQVDRYLDVYRRALARTVTTTAPPLAASRPPG